MWDKELILQRELAEISTEQLRTMLDVEIQKDVTDDDLVMSILHILEEREPEVPDTGSEKEKSSLEAVSEADPCPAKAQAAAYRKCYESCECDSGVLYAVCTDSPAGRGGQLVAAADEVDR